MENSGIEPGHRYWQVVSPIWDKISIYDGPEIFLEQFSKVDTKVGHLYAVHWCQSEVCNGGFHQFFFNSTGILAPEAAEGFRAIGLNDLAEIVIEAMRFFGGLYPRDCEVRKNILDSIPDDAIGDTIYEWNLFDKLDDRFYVSLDSEHFRFEKAADEYAAKVLTEQK